MNKIMYLLLRLFKLVNLAPYLKSLLSMGKKSEVNFPNQLIPLNLEVILKGLLTSRIFEINSDWIYPYWMEKQLNPNDESFIPRGANIFAINTTHRNWTILGFPDFDEKGVVDERGLISPRYNSPSLDIFIKGKDFFFVPSRARKVVQKVNPVDGRVITEFDTENFLLRSSVFSLKEDRGIHLYVNIKGKKDGNYRIYFSIRPYNPESIIPVWEIELKDGIIFVNEDKFLIPETEGANLFISKDEIDVENEQLLNKKKGKSKYGLMTGGIFYDFSLNKDEEKTFHLFLPQTNDRINFKDYPFAERLQSDFWKREKEKELTIVTPDSNLNEIFEANKTYIKSLVNRNYITPGPLTYRHFWFRDSAYMVSALTKIGDKDRAGRILLHFPEKQKKGYFISQKGEWDSNGQAIWTMVEYFRLTKNKDFLAYVYKSIKDGALWIERKRKKYKESMGLLPAGFSAEHFGPNDLYYYDDYFGLRGLKDALFSSKVLGFEKDCEMFLNFYEEFKKDIRRAIDIDQERLGKRIVVGGFGRKIDASMISAFTSIFPLNLDLLTKEEVLNTYALLKEKFFVKNCFYQNITHSGINLYLTLEIAEALLYLGEEEEALRLFDSVISLLSPTFTSPEAINPKTLGGCEGDGHHGWAIAEILHFIRNMFVLEKNKNLYLLSGAKDEWFKDGNCISVKNAYSYFGTINFNVKIDKKSVVIEPEFSFVEEPGEIFIRMPADIDKVREGNFKRMERNYFVFGSKMGKVVFERREE